MRVYALLLLGAILAHAQTNILTVNGNNDRTNANLQETQLSPATVSASTFGKLGSYAVDGQVYAQPLYATNIAIPGVGARNVVYIATMHDTVFAFDADAFSAPGASASPLWQVSLGASVPSQLLYGTPYDDIVGEVGVLGTGAIDLNQGVLYVVADTLVNGAPVFTLHALDLATGAERLNGPATIKMSAAGSAGAVAFDPLQHIQRPGLLLANGSVYIGFGSHGDQAPWHGWLVSYNAGDLTQQNGVFLTTPNGNGGSFWQSGRGVAADQSGTLYAISGNGDYDGRQNFSQSFLRFTGAQPALTGWVTPVNWQSMVENDFDLSAGPALITGTHTLIAADKAGELYVIDGDNMGHSPTPDPQGANVTQVSTGSIFNLAVWSQGPSALVYVQGSQDTLKAFRVTGAAVDGVPVTAASDPLPWERIGLTLSANGADPNSGILWETSGDYNDGTPGALRAYKATDLSVVLWDSSVNSARDGMGAVSKFAAPTVADGRVIVPTFDNVVEVYGLLPAATDTLPAVATIANAASYDAAAVSPGEMIAIFGSHLGPAGGAPLTLDNTGMVPTTLAGVQVYFDGAAAPVTYASDSQVNAIVPFGLSANSTQVTVQYLGQASLPVSVPVAQATPGVFSSDGSGAGPAIVVNQDGSVNSAANPAAPGSVITLYATGAGVLSPIAPDGSIVDASALPQVTLPFGALIGNQPAQVLYAGGAPGMVEGVLQVNLQVPATAAPGGAVPLQLEVGGQSSQQTATLSIGAP
ncbi:MAG: hypothetical protein JST11_28745 [Acidobacteria bacterium]|nr:hypothetical protein [Acidobacteriota bacterium]